MVQCPIEISGGFLVKVALKFYDSCFLDLPALTVRREGWKCRALQHVPEFFADSLSDSGVLPVESPSLPASCQPDECERYAGDEQDNGQCWHISGGEK